MSSHFRMPQKARMEINVFNFTYIKTKTKTTRWRIMTSNYMLLSEYLNVLSNTTAFWTIYHLNVFIRSVKFYWSVLQQFTCFWLGWFCWEHVTGHLVAEALDPIRKRRKSHRATTSLVWAVHLLLTLEKARIRWSCPHAQNIDRGCFFFQNRSHLILPYIGRFDLPLALFALSISWPLKKQ